MFNKRKAERELLYAEINRLKKINEKLEDKNRCLREGIRDIEKYREKYKELIGSVEVIKKSYRDKLNTFEGMSVLYRKELEKLM